MLYINDITDNLDNLARLFADGSKPYQIFRTIAAFA
jgi:hypothetical protein